MTKTRWAPSLVLVFAVLLNRLELLPSIIIALSSLSLFLFLIVKIKENERLSAILFSMLVYTPVSIEANLKIVTGLNGLNILSILAIIELVRHKKTLEPIPEVLRMINWITLSVVLFGLMFSVLEYSDGLKIWAIKAANLIFIVTLVLTVRRFVVSKNNTDDLIYAILFSGLVYLLFSFIDVWLGDLTEGRLNAPQNQPNSAACFSAQAAVFLCAMVLGGTGKKVWIASILLVGFVAVLGLTGSRGGILSLSIAVIPLLFIYWRRAVIGGIFFIGGFIFAYSFGVLETVIERTLNTQMHAGVHSAIEDSANMRLILWRAGGRMLIDAPWFGHGFGAFAFLKSAYLEVNTPLADPHSSPVWIATSFGLIGIMIFISWLCLITWGCLRALAWQKSMKLISTALLCATISSVISNIFGTHIFNGQDNLLWFMSAGFVLATLQMNDTRNTQHVFGEPARQENADEPQPVVTKQSTALTRRFHSG